MKGGVTYQDMEKRRNAAAFVDWMERANPTVLAEWMAMYQWQLNILQTQPEPSPAGSVLIGIAEPKS